ncbi:MAG TPA: HI_0552 family protein [Clostridium sp.]|uniref:HI_0552 family protein n=1 Tax=Clostridium sp. TaxID=1506 RepID=UPI002F93E4FA
MKFNKNIFTLFNRDDFTYRKGDEGIKKEYVEGIENWTLWCDELTKKEGKFESPIIQSWQNSGQLARHFWTRLKFTPFINSGSCVSMHVVNYGFTIELSFEIKNESSSLSKEEYNKLLLENLENWANKYNVDLDLFYICVKTNKCTLNEYFHSSEKINWFANTKGININIGVFFAVELVLELDTESEKLIDILQKLSHLYAKVQKPNQIYNSLKNAEELVPDVYDGSYELVREIVKAYEKVSYDNLTLDDLNAMFFMCIGTFKQGVEIKKQFIRKSNLPEFEKNRIINLIDEIVRKSKDSGYTHVSEGLGGFGMFGEAVGSLRASYKDTDEITGAKDFIKLCISISKLSDDEEIFATCEPVLKAGIKGMQTGKISKFLHCLKPYTFPIINERQGKGTSVYDSLCIKLTKAEKAVNYIQNARAIKSVRDKFFNFQNYRVMDIVEEETAQIRYWLGGAKYDEKDVSQEFITQNVFGIGWLGEDIKHAVGDEKLLENIFGTHDLKDHARKMFNLFFQIKAGDKIAIKSTFAKDKTSILRIKAIGTVQSDAQNGYLYNENLKHTIPVKWENVEQIDLKNVGGHWDTLSEVTNQEHIDRIFFEKNLIEIDKEQIEVSIPIKYSKEQLLEDAYISDDKYKVIVSRLEKKKNIILQGAPGVGKSYLAKKIAYSIIGTIDECKVQMIQFHQSYSYEDFIMGYRPNKVGGFDIIEGVFYKFCNKAIANPNDKFFFIIDEINRGNLSKIFGELMLLIEADKRGDSFAMSTVYSEKPFYIPNNLYIIGLMNTADRSLALIDYALRRRFSFIDIEPAFGENFIKYTDKFKLTNLDKVLNIIRVINDEIEVDESLGKGFKIGHSYFCNLENADNAELLEIIDCEIVPLLEEYWIESNDKVKNYSQNLREAVSNE